MRTVIVVVLCTAAIATAQTPDARQGSEPAVESRQGFSGLSQALPTQPLYGLPLRQQLLLPTSALQPLGAPGLSVPLALNRQGLPGQFYGLGGQGLGAQLGQGLGAQLVSPNLQGLRQGLIGPQLPGLGGQLVPITQLQRQGITNGFRGQVDLRNGLGSLGGQEQLTQRTRANQVSELGVNPFLGRRAANQQEPLADLIQLANILRDDFSPGGSLQTLPKNRLLQQNDDFQDDELSLLLQTLGTLRSLPAPNRRLPTDANASQSPRLTFPPPLGFPLPAGVFPALSHRTGLGNEAEDATNSLTNRQGGAGLSRVDSIYLGQGLGSDRTPTEFEDQFRFPNSR